MNRVEFGHLPEKQFLPPVARPNRVQQKRLDEIERVLKFDPHHPYRRKMVREYLELTDPANDNERLEK